MTLDHPVTKAYVERLAGMDRLQTLLEYILESRWYKKGGQEQLPTDGELLDTILKRPSSSTPKSVFGEFFSVKYPYTCLLCPKGSRLHKRTLERALGHARDHFNFKPIEGYTNENTKNDQLRRAENPTRNCKAW